MHATHNTIELVLMESILEEMEKELENPCVLVFNFEWGYFPILDIRR